MQCVRILVDAGCEINLQDNFDEDTPFDIALRLKSGPLIEYLSE